jgi:hypothetical protein
MLYPLSYGRMSATGQPDDYISGERAAEPGHMTKAPERQLTGLHQNQSGDGEI